MSLGLNFPFSSDNAVIISAFLEQGNFIEKLKNFTPE